MCDVCRGSGSNLWCMRSIWLKHRCTVLGVSMVDVWVPEIERKRRRTAKKSKEVAKHRRDWQNVRRGSQKHRKWSQGAQGCPDVIGSAKGSSANSVNRSQEHRGVARRSEHVENWSKNVAGSRGECKERITMSESKRAIEIIYKMSEKEGQEAWNQNPPLWAPNMIRPDMLYGQETTTPTL